MKKLQKQFCSVLLCLLVLFSVIPALPAAAAPSSPKAVSAYAKLAAGQPVRIAVLGDSIAAGAGTDAEHAWTALLETWLQEQYTSPITLDSFAIGGTDSYTGLYQAEFAMKDAIRASGSYDLVILCYGHNDAAAHFSLLYESLLRSIKRQNNTCQLLTVLESSQQSYTDKMQEIIRLSGLYGAGVADTLKNFALTGSPYEALTDDGTHPNTRGHQIYFETIRDLIADAVRQNPPVPALPVPSEPNVVLLENCHFLPLADCLQADGQYRLTVTHPALGIVCHEAPGHSDLLLSFTDGTIWQGSANAPFSAEWNCAFLTKLLLPTGSLVTLHNPDGKIADTVLGFLVSGPQEIADLAASLQPAKEASDSAAPSGLPAVDTPPAQPDSAGFPGPPAVDTPPAQPDSALQQQVTDIIRAVTTPEMTPEEKLMACANYVIDHCSYKRNVNEPSGVDWPAAYAEEMLTTGQGNCYRYAAAIAFLARGLGFEAQVCAGTCRSSKGGTTPHGWAEVFLGDAWYIFDGSMQDANKQGFFHVTYADYPARRKPLTAVQQIRAVFPVSAKPQ